MDGPLKERDWKYLRSLHDEMLGRLCAVINKGAAALATEQGASAHDLYLKLYRYIHDSDNIVGECFNDWRRSTLSTKILSLRRHGLLTNKHVLGLSPDAQQWLKTVEDLLKHDK
jgi:hypothetical protein